MIHVTKSITVRKPRAEVYQFWRQLERLPSFMIHLTSVTEVSAIRSHWVANAPGGTQVEWDAEIVDQRDNELILWRSCQGSDIQNAGSVHFKDAPADRGTEVKVERSTRGRISAASRCVSFDPANRSRTRTSRASTANSAMNA